MKFTLKNNIELRLFKPEDKESLFNLVDSNREYLSQFLAWPVKTKSPEDSLWFINETIKSSSKKEYVFGVYFKDELAGVCSYNMVDFTNKKTEIGYWLGESFQKNGIITTCVEFLIKHAFAEFKLNRVGILCATENIPSQNIPKKLGFTQEGIIRSNEVVGSKVYDHISFSLIKEDMAL